MRFYGLFYVKNEVSAETSLIFYFYCGSVSHETDKKMSIFFLNFLASKVKLAVVSWKKRAKIMKPSKFGREKN